jgi:hypothetical protein
MPGAAFKSESQKAILYPTLKHSICLYAFLQKQGVKNAGRNKDRTKTDRSNY